MITELHIKWLNILNNNQLFYLTISKLDSRCCTFIDFSLTDDSNKSLHLYTNSSWGGVGREGNVKTSYLYCSNSSPDRMIWYERPPLPCLPPPHPPFLPFSNHTVLQEREIIKLWFYIGVWIFTNWQKHHNPSFCTTNRPKKNYS